MATLVRAARKDLIMFKNIEDFQKFSKEQLDVATESASTLSKGVQAIVTEASDYSKKSFESSTALIEKLLGAKTIESAIQIQSDYAKTSYDAFLAQSSKFGDLYTNLAKEAFKPIEVAVAKVQASAK
jgi:hypothetical protein